MNTSPSNTTPYALATVVLVDPTSADGESSLAELRDADEHVLVVVLATGRACNALRDRAHMQGTSVLSAAWSYLDQIAVKISRPSRVVGTIVANGPDPTFELLAIVAEHPSDRIVLPASMLRIDPALARRLSQVTRVPIDSATLLSA